MDSINIKIKRGGKTSVDVNGAVGDECEKLTDNLMNRLGGTQTTDDKPERHQVVEEKEEDRDTLGEWGS